jgi:ribosomal protein S18 acetylase RimI-like enzyme
VSAPRAAPAIGPIAAADAERVCALWLALFDAHARREAPLAGWRPDAPRLAASVAAWVRNILSGAEGFALVARADGSVAGFVACHVRDQAWLDPPRVGVIGALVVVPRARRRGLGSALVRAAEARFAAEGIGVVEASVGEANRGARRFWRAAGYGGVRRIVARGLQP